ncbi:hypothetical protein A4S05_28845 [Nostoc sp. KVJ20]|uniref:PP2C family serine/threonine-protein phosphatase n=1 Tax=Nostoc sp. KVJ20 TaxID=457944 RepID=UPI00083D4AEB|nr:PP2C family serine/threonine-protein phosphatase [Nostoc sp. KVJ20]ODH01466.1 hypothetical protein A4S05_28845 [Nostoc sp. KVJ20]
MSTSEELTQEELEDLVKTIACQLYIEPYQDKYQQNWNNWNNDPTFQNRINKVHNSLKEMSDQLFAYLLNSGKLGKKESHNNTDINFLAVMWQICMYGNIYTLGHDEKKSEQKDTQKKVQEVLLNVIRKALTASEPEPVANLSSQNSGESPQETPTPPTTANWHYLPVQDPLDKHSEFHCEAQELADSFKIIGARVRGKAHKHQGTNCDDWFEFKTSGNWTIIAVSDGAGSKRLSRIGAKVSCEAAVEYLVQQLQNYSIKERDNIDDLSRSLTRNKKWVFAGEDIEYVQQYLHTAIEQAYKAVEQAATELNNNREYAQKFDKKLEINDFSATLLLALHTTVKAGGKSYSLILTCQIGDGMLAALSRENNLTLLGEPDSGEYGGQTEFLTSKNKLQKANLVQKTFVFAGDIKALMVMTDGVADDYFPSKPGMLALYGDLVLNQVIPIAEPQNKDIVNDELRNTKLRNIQGLQHAKEKLLSKRKRIIGPNTKDEPEEVNIYSIDDYARELAKTVEQVVASPVLLAAAKAEMYQEWSNKRREEKLQLWLDSYYRRASFDDRTLVILYR